MVLYLARPTRCTIRKPCRDPVRIYRIRVESMLFTNSYCQSHTRRNLSALLEFHWNYWGWWSPSIVVSLNNQVNRSLVEIEFLTVFKSADVTLIPKTAAVAARDSDEFRPMSLWDWEYLQNFWDHHTKASSLTIKTRANTSTVFLDYISHRQSGFRPGHSRETALIKITRKWKHATDEGMVIAVVLVHINKVFDSVSHQILVEKLAEVGLPETLTQTVFWFHP